MKTNVTLALNEGRYEEEIGCVTCHQATRATLNITAQVYGVTLDCDECGTSLVSFNQMTQEAA